MLVLVLVFFFFAKKAYVRDFPRRNVPDGAKSRSRSEAPEDSQLNTTKHAVRIALRASPTDAAPLKPSACSPC